MTPIPATEAHEGWLRRVSDYHSGGIDADERAQVEAHLATCVECQEALAMYRRFYALARSPLAWARREQTWRSVLLCALLRRYLCYTSVRRRESRARHRRGPGALARDWRRDWSRRC